MVSSTTASAREPSRHRMPGSLLRVVAAVLVMLFGPLVLAAAISVIAGPGIGWVEVSLLYAVCLVAVIIVWRRLASRRLRRSRE